jgi:putative addiction module component (TIGR02574 family)
MDGAVGNSVSQLFGHGYNSNMVAQNLVNEVLALAVDDRLELYELLRQNLLDDPELDPLTDQQRRILDERLDDIEAGTDECLPWEQVQAELRESLRKRQ